MAIRITTPKVSINQSPIFYNRKWGFLEVITLTGKIIDTDGYVTLLAEQSSVTEAYETMIELAEGWLTRENIYLQSIDFGSSDYLSNTDYTITFKSYPNDYFEQQGILDPSNIWQFSENNVSVLTITHTVSARGINIAPDEDTGLENVRAFVSALVYPAVQVLPESITLFSNSTDLPVSQENIILKSISENTNRLTGEYSVTEVYEYDLIGSSKSIFRYTTNITESAQGFTVASVSGVISGGIDADMSYLQLTLGDSIGGIITEIETYTGLTLNILPRSKTKKINETEKSISFSYEFDNASSNIDNDALMLELSLNESKGDDDLIKYALKGSLKGRLDLNTKWQLIEDYYDSNIDIYMSENVITLFSGYFNIDDINANFTSANVVKSPFKGEIDFTVNITNEEEPAEPFQKIDYTIDTSYPFYHAKPYALVGQRHISDSSEEYVLQNLGYFNKGKLSFSGDAVLLEDFEISDGISALENMASDILSEYVDGDSISTSKSIASNPTLGKKINFTFEWEFTGKPVNSLSSLENPSLY